LCLDEISELEKKLENLKFIPVLSREQWDGKMGYVHNQYLDIIKNTKLNNPIFYLCGWRDMIKEARTNLKELGYDSKSIKVEIYG
jgi:CDP-4-dehydro-6-deoxyglucose reductase